jgi:hypothetical protein
MKLFNVGFTHYTTAEFAEKWKELAMAIEEAVVVGKFRDDYHREEGSRRRATSCSTSRTKWSR